MRIRVLVATSSLGLLAACGGDKPTDKPADTVAAAPATVAATPAVFTITAKEFSYDAPDTVTAGMVTIKLLNQGKELHHVQLLKLDEGHTAAELGEGLKHMKPTDPPPPWIHEVAGPNSPIPGTGEFSITEDIAPGNYAIVCFIPGADHIPHAMKGMVKALTVVPATSASAAAPASDISVTLSDYAFAVTPAITSGKHVIKIENSASQAHEMLIAQLAPGKTPADLAKWVDDMKGPPPATPMGGISGMTKGATVYVPVDLPPGEYGLLCFLPDAKDGKPHVAHGMMTQFTVK
jgi:hypothetical protein